MVAAAAFPGKESPRAQLPGKAVEPGYVAKNRVIWIVFDEWDQAAIFDRRPAGVKLPVLDDFVKHSLVATQVFPPAGDTLLSLPALLIGRPVSAAEVRGDSELRLKYAGDNEWRDFRSSDNIIIEMLRAGKKVAVLGWFHPYGRILPASPNLTARSWGHCWYQGFRGSNVVSAVAAQYRFLAVPRDRSMTSRDNYAEMQAAALAAVADPSIDFILLHYGIPHTPGIYDPTEHRLSAMLRPNTAGYYGNLALADRTLGELLISVAKAGLRVSTAFILTSDHWWRLAPWHEKEPDYRVPLVIRARNDGPAARVAAPLCTVNLPGLVSKMIEGAAFDNAGVVGWLEQKHGPVPVGYIKGVAQWPKPGTAP
ncbi:MAG: sulfatase-like hydrolase/transferase [Verrucomicrobia bacterium]|nr:sulfatase-like hydrolase/transferase [Verrucomicrobiota bacterium]